MSLIRLLILLLRRGPPPGYLSGLAAEHAGDENIVFHGYVAEEDVASFFTQAQLAIFDYDSTTGSSGVLHQAAIYGTPAAYPMMGNFIDVTEREDLKGFNFEPLCQAELERVIKTCLSNTDQAQSFAQNNLDISKSVTMNTVASIQLQLLRKAKKRMFKTALYAKNTALHILEA